MIPLWLEVQESLSDQIIRLFLLLTRHQIKGAVASGKKVIADVGGDLNIESLQENNTYKVDEKSLGFGISLCVTPFCAGMSTIGGGSGNFDAANIDSNYASVTEQSGISLTEYFSIRRLQRPSGRRRKF